MKGRESEDVLKHEKLHLRIGEYIAKKAMANMPTIVGKGEATNADRQKAAAEARDKAVADFNNQFGDFWKKWGSLDKAAQQRYDAQTKNGTDATSQKDWEAKWQTFVDEILKKGGWGK